MREKRGRHGGTLLVLEKGDRLKGSGRPRNPFKEAIRAAAEQWSEDVRLSGRRVVAGVVTDEIVEVVVSLPAVEAVVMKMFKKAAKKGDVAAARWLTDTAFGKTVNLADDPENPLSGGFAVILPANGR
jgi:hypothetical protein